MNTKEQLPRLLEKFYSGETSPEEELMLYLHLLDEPSNSIYQADLKVVEMLFIGAQQIQRETLLVKRKNKWYSSSTIKKYAIAAALPLALTLGLIGLLRNPSEELSFRNNTYIAQEEVDIHAERAFSLLNDCLESGYTNYTKAQSAINDASEAIEASYQQLEPLMEHEAYGWETLELYQTTN